MTDWTIAGLAAMVSYFTTNAMQLIKPFIELIPGIMLKKNQAVHDNLIRLVQIGINLGATALLAVTTPLYRGMPWWSVVLIGLGQATASHVTYALTSTGGSPMLDDPVLSIPSDPVTVSASAIPTIPRQ